ncbi:MAG: hypothetical protein AAGM38_09690 [Pseudomonadota bacterium]
MGYSGRRLAEELCVSVLRDRLTGPSAPLPAIEYLVCVALLKQAYSQERCGACRFNDVCCGYVNATAARGGDVPPRMGECCGPAERTAARGGDARDEDEADAAFSASVVEDAAAWRRRRL